MTQTEKNASNKTQKFLFSKNFAKQVICKNLRAAKYYWPILFACQLPLIAVLLVSANKQFAPNQKVAIDKKSVELHKQHAIRIKNIEQHFTELNQRFLALQNQHAKLINSIISIKSSVTQQHTNTQPIDFTKKNTLETLDMIGEKIKLNEPFSGLLMSFTKNFSTFPGYRTLYQFSSRMPLSFLQIKKTFEDLRKNHTSAKVSSNLPGWLEKIASLFHGNIKIEKINQIEEDSIQPIADALEIQDLKLAHSLAKEAKIQSIKLWSKFLAERILLEDEYSVFVENVHNWVNRTTLEKDDSNITIAQENLP